MAMHLRLLEREQLQIVQDCCPGQAVQGPRDLASADLLPSQAVVADGDRAFVFTETGEIAVLALARTRPVSRE